MKKEVYSGSEGAKTNILEILRENIHIGNRKLALNMIKHVVTPTDTNQNSHRDLIEPYKIVKITEEKR